MLPETNNMKDNGLELKVEQQERAKEKSPNEEKPRAVPKKYEFRYLNLVTFSYWHMAALLGVYYCFTYAKWATVIFALFLYVCAEIGITAGVHRLWSHKSYKAKLPLEILLMVFNSIAYQNSAIHWARDHRMHHKYSDTDADPHNARRGFFYSHVGWILIKKHPDVKEKGKTINISDLESNPVLQFQRKYGILIMGAACFALPTLIPVFFWGETLTIAWHINMLRYVLNLNATFLVNSAAHMFGYKPYDNTLLAVQNITVSAVTFGEGFHNYHHVFPWDYKTAELGNNTLNWTTLFIDFFAWIGWAYDLKTVGNDVIRRRAERTGDGTNLWGSDVDGNNFKTDESS